MLPLPKMLLATALAAAFFTLSGTDVTTMKASEPAGPEAATAAPVTAKTAYLAMYKSAYKWSPDVVLLKLNPDQRPGFAFDAGKAGIWEAMFASPSKHEYRIFTYAVAAHSPDVYKGVTVGNAIPWSGPTRDVTPIPSADFTVDSDAAYNVAAADGAAWIKKNPDKKVTAFQLGNGYSFPSPVWYIVWGDKKSGGYVALVNATTGKVMKK